MANWGGDGDPSGSTTIVVITSIVVAVLIPIICLACVIINTRDIIRNTREVKDQVVATSLKLREGTSASLANTSPEMSQVRAPPAKGIYSGTIGIERRRPRDIDISLDFRLDKRTGGYDITGVGEEGKEDYVIREGFIDHGSGQAYWVEKGRQFHVDCCLRPCVRRLLRKYAYDIQDIEEMEIIALVSGKFDWRTGNFKGRYQDSKGRKSNIRLECQEKQTEITVSSSDEGSDMWSPTPRLSPV